jgi:hypothetical protein
MGGRVPDVTEARTSGSSGETLNLGVVSAESLGDLAQIAVEAYVFLYSLVNMDAWRHARRVSMRTRRADASAWRRSHVHRACPVSR